jgi:hypothetical protein
MRECLDRPSNDAPRALRDDLNGSRWLHQHMQARKGVAVERVAKPDFPQSNPCRPCCMNGECTGEGLWAHSEFNPIPFAVTVTLLLVMALSPTPALFI